MKYSKFILLILITSIAVLLNACAPSSQTHPLQESNDDPKIDSSTATPTLPAFTPTPQPTSTLAVYGPDKTDFPGGINPLTGQPVSDPSLLKIPAMLVSISHFPATARQQAGLSFAPFVFEFSITEGQSRFLAAFYGQWPAPEIPITGDCEIRKGVFQQTGVILGNRVWLDKNKNGIQDIDEPGIGGICVNLYDAAGNLVDKTTTDSNGYYGFNVEDGQKYIVEFVRPEYLDFTQANVGDEDHDSDADPLDGKSPAARVEKDNLSVDAGMVPNDAFAAPTPDPKHDPRPQVGPVRSGRLLYGYLANLFHDSCLVYAFASEEVLAKIPHCSFVAHEVSGGGMMFDIDRMKAIAEDNMRRTAEKPFNYTSNLFSDEAPAGGLPASQINVFFASLNQSGWTYDPLYQAWLRSVDDADKFHPGVLHLEVDRLTGRQLHFENVIVLMADEEVVSPTNLDIKLDQGEAGYAYLFRDGKVYPIRWNTLSGEYEKKTGFERPIKFTNADGSPAALKPGHTWVTIVTPFSYFAEQKSGVYLVRYAAPEGEAR